MKLIISLFISLILFETGYTANIPDSEKVQESKSRLNSDSINIQKIKNLRKSMGQDSTAPKNRKLPSLDVIVLHICPVCKMDLKNFLIDTTSYGGKIYGFCSEHCKVKFISNPEIFVKSNLFSVEKNSGEAK